MYLEESHASRKIAITVQQKLKATGNLRNEHVVREPWRGSNGSPGANTTHPSGTESYHFYLPLIPRDCKC